MYMYARVYVLMHLTSYTNRNNNNDDIFAGCSVHFSDVIISLTTFAFMYDDNRIFFSLFNFNNIYTVG